MKMAILAVLLIFLVAEVLFLAPSSVNNPIEKDQAAVSPLRENQEFSQVMRGVEVIGMKDHRKDWELWAEEGLSAKVTGNWHLKQMRSRFFGIKGLYFDVKGDEAQVQVSTKNMKVYGNVEIKSSNGYTFLSSEMTYDSRTRKLNCPTPVKMIGPPEADGSKMNLRADEMEADLGLSVMNLRKNVQGEKGLPKNRMMHIRSDAARFSGDTHSAKFLGRVLIDVEQMRISGPEADFVYDPEMKQVSSVNVKGGAKVTDAAKWATADRVYFDLKSEKFVFNGNPRLVQNNDELRGEQIVFLEGGKRVQVKGAKARVDEQHVEKVN